MQRNRITLSLIAFSLVFLVLETAEVQAQLFGRRGCNPCCGRPRMTRQQLCCREIVCEAYGEEDIICTGQCEVVYEGNQWHVKQKCVLKYCHCPLEVVSGNLMANSHDCAPPPSNITEGQFRLILDSGFASGKSYVFHVSEVPGSDITMNEVCVEDSSGQCCWRINVSYDTDEVTNPSTTEPGGTGRTAKSQIYYDHGGTDGFRTATHREFPLSGGNTVVIHRYGHFVVTVEKVRWP